MKKNKELKKLYKLEQRLSRGLLKKHTRAPIRQRKPRLFGRQSGARSLGRLM